MNYNKENKNTENALMDKRINNLLDIHYNEKVSIDKLVKILCKKYNYNVHDVYEKLQMVDLYWGI